MSLKSDYNDFITYKDRLLCDKTTKYWINQEERYIEPFQIFGNLYYVGDTWVCVHIVDTGAGVAGQPHRPSGQAYTGTTRI